MPDPAAGPAGADRQRGAGADLRLEAVVSGRVQGVGFRAYVRGWARKLGLVGYVRNEPDGTVRLVAEGSADALDRLARLLWGGPPGARVAAVDAERRPAAGAFGAFEVRR